MQEGDNMRFFPKNIEFFDLFIEQSEFLSKSIKLLRDLEDDNDIKKRARNIKEIEHEADLVVQKIIINLNKTFITPIDREDIALLACRIDDVLDELEKAINRIYIYKINPNETEVFQYFNLIAKIMAEIIKAIKELKNNKNKEDVLKHCEIVNLLENQADDLNRHTLTKLMNEEKDAIKLIKLKEIYETLENVTDRSEDVANVLETIIIKNL